MKGKTILVGMSGGVDSTVAALLLKNKGFHVIGVTMKIWGGESGFVSRKKACYGPGEEEDLTAAREACNRLGIEHYTADLAHEYHHHVLTYFKDEYVHGRTPNPCVVCNQKMKFGALVDSISDMGIAFDFFATGHYARIVLDDSSNRVLLLRGFDTRKDQSYFLGRLTQDQLRRTVFPLGVLSKAEVKRLAIESGLIAFANKPESQDFIEAESYAVLFEPAASQHGDIVDLDGNVLGKHEGIFKYTVGQRKGLGIGGSPEPMYVLSIDPEKNRIVVGGRNDGLTDTFHVHSINWIAIDRLNEECSSAVKVRATGSLYRCRIAPEKDGGCTVRTENAPFAVTPGQAAVFYDGETVLGSGFIGENPGH